MQKLFLTLFYIGKIPSYAHIFAMLFATLLAIALLKIAPITTLFLATLLLSLIAIKEINSQPVIQQNTIMIDKLSGIWIALTLSSHTEIQILLSLLFFYLYDRWHPSIIGRVARDFEGGIGVIGAALLSGIFAGLSSSIVYGTLLKLHLLS